MKPHQRHRDRWIVNFEGSLSTVEFGKLLERYGRELAGSGSLRIDGTTVDAPEAVHAVVRHEEAPHGLVLKFEAHWGDGESQRVTKQIGDLLLEPVQGSK